MRVIKGNLKPAKKTVRVATGNIPKTMLSEAVRHNCSKEIKFSIVDWIQRTFDKRTSDEVSLQIGLIEAKQQKRSEKVAEKPAEAEAEGEAPSKKLKTAEKLAEEPKKSPIKSPIKTTPAEQKN